MAVERVTGDVEAHVVRQDDRKLLARHRHGSAACAMDDRDRRAPITLARYAPVSQSIGRGALAPSRLLGAPDHFGSGLFARQSIEKSGVYGYAVGILGLAADRFGRQISARRDDALDRQMILLRKFEIALIMAG